MDLWCSGKLETEADDHVQVTTAQCNMKTPRCAMSCGAFQNLWAPSPYYQDVPCHVGLFKNYGPLLHTTDHTILRSLLGGPLFHRNCHASKVVDAACCTRAPYQKLTTTHNNPQIQNSQSYHDGLNLKPRNPKPFSQPESGAVRPTA